MTGAPLISPPFRHAHRHSEPRGGREGAAGIRTCWRVVVRFREPSRCTSLPLCYRRLEARIPSPVPYNGSSVTPAAQVRLERKSYTVASNTPPPRPPAPPRSRAREKGSRKPARRPPRLLRSQTRSSESSSQRSRCDGKLRAPQPRRRRIRPQTQPPITPLSAPVFPSVS